MNGRITCGLIGVLLLAGCGDEFDRVPVSGRVTLNGEPFVGAHVQFQPVAQEGQTAAGQGSFGVTDDNGHYSQEGIEGQAGAVPGPNRVIISRTKELPASDLSSPLDSSIPEKYTDGSTLFEVPAGGTEQADFELSK